MSTQYDVYDRRIAKSVDSDGDGNLDLEERYVLDGDEIALVFDEEGNLKERFLHGVTIDQVIAQENTDGSVYWALADNLGSVRYVLDNDGNIINSITYDAFGEVTAETDPSVDFRFGYTGRELDEETGQHYYRSRYYDSSVGRFISEDTIGFAGGDVNLYRYVGNNSINATDPTGEFANFAVQAGIGAGVDLTIQLIQHKGDISKVDWMSVAMSALSGALGGVVSAKAAVKFASLLQRVVVNGLASGGIDAGLQVGRNALTGCNLSDNVLEQGLIGGLGGALGEIVQPLFKQLDSFIRGADGNIDDAVDGLARQIECFVAGTLIATPDGFIPIEQIKVGDRVYTGSEQFSGEISVVKQLFQKQVDKVGDIIVNEVKITCTSTHPFWIRDYGWKLAHELQVGDELLTKDGKVLSIESVIWREGEETVYNFEVENYHTYYVSKLAILVHNMCGKNNKSEPSPVLKDNPYHPDTVDTRRNEAKEYYNNLFDSKIEAGLLGYKKRIAPQKVPFNSHGQEAFFDGKTYITRDVDSHIGGVWKKFNKKGQRIGTFDGNLNQVGK